MNGARYAPLGGGCRAGGAYRDRGASGARDVRDARDACDAGDARGASGLRQLRRIALAASLAVLGLPAAAVDWQPFAADTPAALRARFADRSFVFAFWSINCAPCRDELADWPAWQKRFPKARVVFVNTDEAADLPAAESFLHKLKLSRAEHWNFADEMPERLRWAVSPSWHGELPFSLFYDRRHQPTTHYGRLDAVTAARWLAAADGAAAAKSGATPARGTAPRTMIGAPGTTVAFRGDRHE